MDTKGNLYIYNRDGSLREVIPPGELAAADVDAEIAEAAVEEKKATAEVYKTNRHERRKAAVIARRKKETWPKK